MPRPAQTPESENDSDVKRAVRIQPTAIQEEYANLPAMIHRWLTLLAHAEEQHLLAKLDLKEWEAKERLKIREVAELKGTKPPTVDAIDAHIEAHEKYRQLSMAIIKTEHDRDEVFATVEALRAKKEMLISLGATMRQEIEGNRELLIRERRGG